MSDVEKLAREALEDISEYRDRERTGDYHKRGDDSGKPSESDDIIMLCETAEELANAVLEQDEEIERQGEEIEALHIALRASGERREEAESRVRQMEEALRTIANVYRWEQGKLRSAIAGTDYRINTIIRIADKVLDATEPESFRHESGSGDV